jgi:hypothetical protein
LKLDTTGAPLWFKAVGEPNLTEYSVTIGLNQLMPGTGPTILAKFPQWNAWVTEDLGGRPLDTCSEPNAWLDASTHLADLQIASLKHVDTLFAMGCTDCRTVTLTRHLEPFLKAMQMAMERDAEVQSLRLSSVQIQQVAAVISRVIDKIEMLEVPNALVHRDLSGGNIQMSSQGCYFLDWAQACIANPFICLEYMQAHLGRALRGRDDCDFWTGAMADAYASRWSALLNPKQMKSARDYSPLLAEYLYVIPMDGRTPMDLLDTREGRATMRSMARRMWSETRRDVFQHLGQEG